MTEAHGHVHILPFILLVPNLHLCLLNIFTKATFCNMFLVIQNVLPTFRKVVTPVENNLSPA